MNQLEHLVAQTEGTPIVINQYFYWFSFDVMSQVSFSKSFNMLRHREWHHAIQLLRFGMALVGPFTPVPWLMRIGSDIPALQIARNLNNMVAWCAQHMDERIEVRIMPRIMRDALLIVLQRSVEKPDVQSLQNSRLEPIITCPDLTLPD